MHTKRLISLTSHEMQTKLQWESTRLSSHSEWDSLRKQLTNPGKGADIGFLLGTAGRNANNLVAVEICTGDSQTAKSGSSTWLHHPLEFLKGLQASTSQGHWRVSLCCSCSRGGPTVKPNSGSVTRGIVKESVVWRTDWNYFSSEKEWQNWIALKMIVLNETIHV